MMEESGLAEIAKRKPAAEAADFGPVIEDPVSPDAPPPAFPINRSVSNFQGKS